MAGTSKASLAVWPHSLDKHAIDLIDNHSGKGPPMPWCFFARIHQKSQIKLKIA
jgi:hypothetical protein